MNHGGGTDDLARFFNDAKDIDFLFVIDVNRFHSRVDRNQKNSFSISSIASLQTMPLKLTILRTSAQHYNVGVLGDEELVAGFWSMVQPVVRPVIASKR